jgi:hypothetical protein
MDFDFAVWLGVLCFVVTVWFLALSTMGRATQFDENGMVFKPLVGRTKTFLWREFDGPATQWAGPLPRVVLRRADRTFWSFRQAVVVLLDASSYSSDFLAVVAASTGVHLRSA